MRFPKSENISRVFLASAWKVKTSVPSTMVSFTVSNWTQLVSPTEAEELKYKVSPEIVKSPVHIHINKNSILHTGDSSQLYTLTFTARLYPLLPHLQFIPPPLLTSSFPHHPFTCPPIPPPSITLSLPPLWMPPSHSIPSSPSHSPTQSFYSVYKLLLGPTLCSISFCQELQIHKHISLQSILQVSQFHTQSPCHGRELLDVIGGLEIQNNTYRYGKSIWSIQVVYCLVFCLFVCCCCFLSN